MDNTINSFYEQLIKDPPFSYPEPDERSKRVLVGSAAQKFENSFVEVYHGCMQSSMMTAVIGPPRSGKSQFINHFEYNVNERKFSQGITILLKPSGETFGELYLLKKIILDDIFQRKLEESNIQKPNNPENRDQLIITINNVIKNMQAKHGNTAGICLCVDNVDEQIRLMTGSQTKVTKEDIQKFLGVFRILIGDINKGLCVLFALTEDTRIKVESALDDQTLRGRFVIINDINGNPMQLEAFMENEAYELVSAYMKNWSERQNIPEFKSLPMHEGCSSNEKNLYPFSKDAVKYFWRAGLYPGFICFACKQAIIKKYYNLKKTKDDIINVSDAAAILQTYSNNFPGIVNVKEELKLILGAEQIDSDISKLVNEVKLKYASCFERVKEIYDSFLISLDPSITVEEKKSLMIPQHKSESKEYYLDLIIKYREKAVGISFVDSLFITKEKIMAISSALKQNKITHGIIYCIPKLGELGEPKLDTRHDHNALLEFNDLVHRKDYRPVKILRKLENDNVWKIIGVSSIQNNETRTQYANFLDRDLQIMQDIQNIISSKSADLSKLHGPKMEYIT
jgi:hypothetical protein